MADISGRRDRNKKSPGVHYDMHRCVRAAVICTVSLQNATWVCDSKCDGEEREEGRGGRGRADEYINIYICVYTYICICVTYFESYRTTLEAPRSTDTARHRYMEKISAQAVIRKIDALYCERERERGLSYVKI